MFQEITIVGNLGGDPEMRYFPDGSAVTNFSVAANRKWKKDDGEYDEETTWFRISVFGRQAETCNEYLEKGRLVLVKGRLTSDRKTGGPRLWKGQDDTVRASYEVRAHDVRFLGGASSAGDASYASEPASEPHEEDEIPF